MALSGSRSPVPRGRYSNSGSPPRHRSDSRDWHSSRRRSRSRDPNRGRRISRSRSRDTGRRDSFGRDRRPGSRETDSPEPDRFMNPERQRMMTNGPADRDYRRGDHRSGRGENGYERDEYRRDSVRYDTRDGKRDGESFQQFLERRKQMRDASTVSIWPPSPEIERNLSPSPNRKPKSRKSRNGTESPEPKKRRSRKRDMSDDSVDESESESDSEDDRRSRKKKKRSSSSRKHKSKSRKGRKDKKRSKKRTRGRSPTPSSSSADSASESEEDNQLAKRRRSGSPAPAVDGKPVVDATVQDYWREKAVEPVEDAPVGPMPLNMAEAKHDERAYGGALLAGEGSAMAAYLQSGKRIPRRGEIGLQSEEIESFEDVGYVMSGSRHRRMNAVRIRKENQVISAEEKRALLLFNQEANLKKEADIIANFKDMVTAKLRGKEGGPSQD
ncbi:uncharacterized protein SPPG_01262 [Spizellomyces punctatus DAOM BR117]|uniref:NF-kappa-B-activating protein C-terminal domain-containing protein n=1 Tax=Spizellomyces punctatus (strain DAOM BR117) TaxID=645134 RepID=A0A0L0HR01_SPIPD|nr:uncharacterized protein SPPG_01262 [Spizellomyces punctatus DAOM BR117]KND03806.1 hypothetical protein SPPG_01262 [Spizellomyces punctatus DAOM BR117]|eukprot:XP_016611845.1 hypothetical protein SPPG_01262 [Spizellomyces punctatus DAOM BR117]